MSSSLRATGQWPSVADWGGGMSASCKQRVQLGCFRHGHLTTRFVQHVTRSSGWCRLVTFRLRFDSHRRSFASNLEKVANLLCAQVNSASYPQRDGKWVVAYGIWGEAVVWLTGEVVCLLVAPRIQLSAGAGSGRPRIVRCGIISSCQSAATSEIVKRFWSRVWLV